MKQKHIEARIKQCRILAELSPCPRRKIGAVLLDPVRNMVLSDGYNGTPRDCSGDLCGGNTCVREEKQIQSGTMLEHGCHHAESNALMNACSFGTPTVGAWMFISSEPCLMCAKSIHHAGIEKIIIVGNQYTENNGIEYLKEYGIDVEYYEEEKLL